jgi:hypothetical protein
MVYSMCPIGKYFAFASFGRDARLISEADDRTLMFFGHPDCILPNVQKMNHPAALCCVVNWSLLHADTNLPCLRL